MSPVVSNRRNQEAVQTRASWLPNQLDWYGAQSVDEVRNMTGWPEGLALAERYRTELPTFTMPTIGRRRVWTDDGDDFSRDRFDAGYENAWAARRRTVGPSRPVLRLTCAIGGCSKRKAHELAWSGAAAFAVCDAAEDAGYRLEIEAVSHTVGTWTSGDHGTVQIIRIKDADQPLDREAAVMALACPAFFRWHVIGSRANLHPNYTVATRVVRRNRRYVRGGWGVTQPIPHLYWGDLHMEHAYDAYSALAACKRLIGRIEQLATGDLAVAR